MIRRIWTAFYEEDGVLKVLRGGGVSNPMIPGDLIDVVDGLHVVRYRDGFRLGRYKVLKVSPSLSLEFIGPPELAVTTMPARWRDELVEG